MSLSCGGQFDGPEECLHHVLYQHLVERMDGGIVLEMKLPNAFEPIRSVNLLAVGSMSRSQIARAIRATRSLKLVFRATGKGKTGVLTVTYDPAAVVLTSCTITDAPKFEVFRVVINSESMNGLRVLASATLSELYDLLVTNKMEIAQLTETMGSEGAVISSILTGAPGVNGPNSRAKGGSMADEIIMIELMDSDGLIKQYVTPEDISAIVSSLGIVGFVYAITFRYHDIQLLRVNNYFVKWSELMEGDDRLMTEIETNEFTELTYIPFNSIELEGWNEAALQRWDPQSEEVLIRTGTEERVLIEGENDHYRFVNPREILSVIDPDFRPFEVDFVRDISNAPRLLKQAYMHLKARLLERDNIVQFGPWARNAWFTRYNSIEFLRYTFEVDRSIIGIRAVFRKILFIMQALTNGVLGFDHNTVLNHSVRINFTGRTSTSRIFGVGFRGYPGEPDRTIMVHVTFAALVVPGRREQWKQADEAITTLFYEIGYCMPQWRTDWQNYEHLAEKFKEAFKYTMEPVRAMAASTDRDGMFLSRLLERVYYTELTDDQRRYRQW